MNRRQFCGSVGAIISMSTAGCSSDSATSSPTEKTTDKAESSKTITQSPEQPPETRSGTPAAEATILIDDTITLPEGENSYADFSVSEPATVEYDFSVEENKKIDLFVLSLSNFQRYRSKQSFTSIKTIDSSGGMGTVNISRGNYYVVLDHSERGPTEPPGQFGKVSATVEATISYTTEN